MHAGRKHPPGMEWWWPSGWVPVSKNPYETVYTIEEQDDFLDSLRALSGPLSDPYEPGQDISDDYYQARARSIEDAVDIDMRDVAYVQRLKIQARGKAGLRNEKARKRADRKAALRRQREHDLMVQDAKIAQRDKNKRVDARYFLYPAYFEDNERRIAEERRRMEETVSDPEVIADIAEYIFEIPPADRECYSAKQEAQLEELHRLLYQNKRRKENDIRLWAFTMKHERAK